MENTIPWKKEKKQSRIPSARGYVISRRILRLGLLKQSPNDHFCPRHFHFKSVERIITLSLFIPKSENELEKEILKNLERKILNVSFSEAEWLLMGGEGGCAGTLRPAKRRR